MVSNTARYGPGQIQRGPRDVRSPLRRCGRPATGTARASPYQAQRPTARPALDVDDRGRPLLTAARSEPGEQGLVQPEGGGLADPVGVIDQDGAIGDHRVVDGVPVTAQLDRDLVHGAAPPADLFGHPPARPIGQRQPRRRDRRLVARSTIPVGQRRLAAHPAMLAPHQPSPPPEHREIHQLHLRTVLHLGDCPASADMPGVAGETRRGSATARPAGRPPRARSHRGDRPAARTCAEG